MMRNLFWATLHHGLGRAAFFVFFLALPRLMDIEMVGRFTFWYTVFLVLCQPPLDYALTMVVVKYTARGDLGVVRRAFVFALRFLPLLLIGLWLASVCFAAPYRLIGALLVYLGFSLSLNLVFGYFRGLEFMQVEGVVGSLQKVLGLALLFALFGLGFRGYPLPALALVGMGIGGWILLLMFYSGRVRALVSSLRSAAPNTRSALSIWREGLQLGAVGLVGLLYLRIDVLMLGAIVGPEEVGLYFTASKFVEAAYIVPHVVMLVYFPRLVKSKVHKPELARIAVILATLSLLALAAVLALGRWGVPLIYGDSMTQMSTLVMVLAPTVVPVFLGYLLTQVLVAMDLQRRYLVLAAGGLLLNLILNAALIPLYQGMGAAIATVLTELTITVSAAVLVRRFSP